MRKPAWISRCKTWMRRPAARIGLVIVLGTCLWAMVGRSDRGVGNVVASAEPDIESASVERSRPPVSLGVRKLPQRMLSRPVEIDSAPIHADYEMRAAPERPNIHAAGFTVEVTPNAPAWLTGTIEFE